MSTFNGPLAACNTLAELVDDIGDPIISLINASTLSLIEKGKLKEDIEAVLTEVFLGPKVNSLRSYTYDQWREKKALL